MTQQLTSHTSADDRVQALMPRSGSSQVSMTPISRQSETSGPRRVLYKITCTYIPTTHVHINKNSKNKSFIKRKYRERARDMGHQVKVLATQVYRPELDSQNPHQGV